jgi:rhodanese-related sulfurtransferase
MAGPERTVNDKDEISRDELQAKIARGDTFHLLETLPASYYRHSHLPGAVNLPVDEIPRRARQLLPTNDAEVVVYCLDENCAAASQAARMLRSLGYRRVREYRGGKADWRAAGLPLEGESRRLREAQRAI